MKKRLMSLTLICCLVVSMIPTISITAGATGSDVSSGSCGENLTWSYDESIGTLTISGTGDMEDYNMGNPPWGNLNVTKIVIEEGVTSVGTLSFAWNEKLQTVSLPSTLEKIGEGGFRECFNLSSISFPSGLTSIGSMSFWNCDSLESVFIPRSVSFIDDVAFATCSVLTEINVDPDNSQYCSVDGVLYSKDQSVLECYPAGKSGSTYSIAANVAEIMNYAFWECHHLQNINVDSGNAKYSSLDGIIFNKAGTVLEICPPGKSGSYNIPNKVQEIAPTAFYSSRLNSINIPESVTQIGCNAFERCYELTNVNLPSNITEIADYLFSRCEKLGSISIPAGVTKIGEYAFSGTAIQKIAIPAQVNELKWATFYDCPDLVYVILPASVTVIAEDALRDCPHLTDVYYGGSEEEWNAIRVVSYDYAADEGEGVSTTIGEMEEFLPGVTIHFNSDGSEAPDPTLPGQITGVLPGNQSKDTISYNFDAFHIGFTKDVAQSSKSNYASLNFSSEPFAVYRAADDQLIYQVEESNEGYSFDVLSYVSSKNRIIIQPMNAWALLQKDTEYYITMGEGFVQFADGTGSTAIEKGDWVFRTAPDYPGIIPLVSDTIVQNGNGGLYLPVLITDQQDNALPNHEVSWEYMIDSHNYRLNSSTDENGVAVLGPILSSIEKITICTNIPDLGKIRKTLPINLSTNSLSFNEVFELELGANISLSNMLFGTKGGVGANNKLIFKFIVQNGETTLEISRERKGSVDGSVTAGLWQQNAEYGIKMDNVSASISMDQNNARTLRIQNFDADNPKHISLIGYYILDQIVSDNVGVPATIKQLLQEYGYSLFGDSIDKYNKQKQTLSKELEAGVKVTISAPILGSFSAEAFDRSTKYEQSIEHDSGKNETTVAASIENSNGNLILSGDWVMGVLGSTIFADELNKDTVEVAVVTNEETGIRSIKLESTNKNYDGIAGTEKGDKVKDTVVYSEATSETPGDKVSELIDTTPFLQCLDNQSFAMLTPDYVQQIYNRIYEKNLVGTYTRTKIFNSGLNFSGQVNAANLAKISYSANGDKRFEADVITGRTYAGKAYAATDTSTSITSTTLESHGFDLEEVLSLSMQGLGSFMINAIIDTAGKVIDGVFNGIASVFGTVQDSWYVTLSRISGENPDVRTSLSRAESAPSQSATKGKLQFVAKDQNGVKQTVEALSDPYIVQVYTDGSKSTPVSDSQLEQHPLNISFAYDSIDNEVGIFKWDNNEQMYIPVTDLTVDAAKRSISGKLDANTEYILGRIVLQETDSSSGSSGGGSSASDKPAVSVSGTGGKATASGSTVTITPDAGYQIASITVNGETVEIPADGKLTGLDKNDKVVVTFEKIPAEQPDPDEEPFTDVADSAWFADAVQYVYENGVMNGISATSFGPDMTTNRAMIVTILHRLEGEPTAEASDFTDVADGMYYADAIDWAAANGIVNGVSETRFAPNDPITREQMAAILYRYAQFKGYDVTASADLSAFTDAAQISAYAATAMQWANGAGLITGVTSTTLNPQGSATRAQVATILMRFCEDIAN